MADISHITYGSNTWDIKDATARTEIEGINSALAGKQDNISSVPVTIDTTDWSNNTCTKTVSGVTADNVVVIAPDPSTRSIYNTADVYCSAQAANSLTFSCSKTPTAAVVANILII